MRKVILIVTAVFLNNAIVFSQDRTDDILKEFERQKLSVELVGQFSGSVSPYLGVMSGSTYNKWIGYQGFKKISESEFFQIAGFEKEANEALIYNESAKKELTGGIIAESVGLAIYFIGLFQKKEIPGEWIGDYYFPSYNEPDPNWPLVALGAGVATVGVVYIFKGSKKISRNWAPAQIALSSSEKYNEKLKLKYGL